MQPMRMGIRSNNKRENRNPQTGWLLLRAIWNICKRDHRITCSGGRHGRGDRRQYTGARRGGGRGTTMLCNDRKQKEEVTPLPWSQGAQRHPSSLPGRPPLRSTRHSERRRHEFFNGHGHRPSLLHDASPSSVGRNSGRDGKGN